MFFWLVDSIVYSYTTCLWDYVSTEQNEQFQDFFMFWNMASNNIDSMCFKSDNWDH